ncbi:MAG: CDP-alcohol phosphatidyltransferase family protein [Bacteroidota bacterium]|nr:CDP-alcohol phosphatidyltransferase family protein [Bacteroidota bacterium]
MNVPTNRTATVSLKERRFVQLVYRFLSPLVILLVRLGVTPNMLTTTGLLLNIIAAAVFILGAEYGSRWDYSFIGWASALLLFAGLFDMLDGQVARAGNNCSRFGAIFDSVMDRYSELFMFLGICYYLVAHHYLLSSLFAFIAMIGSIMVSYTRARAEGAGVECSAGLMQRPARILIIGVAGIACALTAEWLGSDARIELGLPGLRYAELISVFTLPITLVAVLSNITAMGRLLSCHAQLNGRGPDDGASLG